MRRPPNSLLNFLDIDGFVSDDVEYRFAVDSNCVFVFGDGSSDKLVVERCRLSALVS